MKTFGSWIVLGVAIVFFSLGSRSAYGGDWGILHQDFYRIWTLGSQGGYARAVSSYPGDEGQLLNFMVDQAQFVNRQIDNYSIKGLDQTNDGNIRDCWFEPVEPNVKGPRTKFHELAQGVIWDEIPQILLVTVAYAREHGKDQMVIAAHRQRKIDNLLKLVDEMGKPVEARYLGYSYVEKRDWWKPHYQDRTAFGRYFPGALKGAEKLDSAKFWASVGKAIDNRITASKATTMVLDEKRNYICFEKNVHWWGLPDHSIDQTSVPLNDDMSLIIPKAQSILSHSRAQAEIWKMARGRIKRQLVQSLNLRENKAEIISVEGSTYEISCVAVDDDGAWVKLTVSRLGQ
jgi:hypothetical protein